MRDTGLCFPCVCGHLPVPSARSASHPPACPGLLGLGFSPDPAGPFGELASWGAALSAAGGSSPAQQSPPGLALTCPPEPAGSSSLDIGRGSSALRSGPLGSPPTSDTL